jgi:hypothetical protein
VCSDKNGAKFLEVAVLLILDFSYAPGILSALYGSAIGGLNVFLGSYHGEWHGGDKTASVSETSLIIFL